MCECVPSCEGRECGPDGCGGVCGQCVRGLSCSLEGACECVPDCGARHCGADGCGGYCSGVACDANPSLNTVLRTAGGWYIDAAANSLVSNDPEEEVDGGEFLGALLYGHVFHEEGLQPVYRLNNYGSASGTGRDHMLSVYSDEGEPDYTDEGVSFYSSQAPFPGSGGLYRFLRESPFDHTVAIGNEAPDGYLPAEMLLGHVYPRFGLSDEDLVPISGAEVELKINRVAGGSVWELNWGGKSFINIYDFGRQLQIAFQLNNAGEQDNPTEAGSFHSTPGTPDGWRQGAPLLALEIDATVLTTLTRPLQWFPEGFHDGNPIAHPVVWNGTIGKRVELDFQGQPNIIHWTTTIDFPQDQRFINLELATAYLPGDFDRFYAYDAIDSVLTERTAEIPGSGCVDPAAHISQRPEIGGVIIATASGSHAMGAYRNRRLGSNEGYGLCAFPGTSTGVRDFATTKWNLLERPPGGLPAGQYEWELFVVVGTLDDTISAMNWLYHEGH